MDFPFWLLSVPEFFSLFAKHQREKEVVLLIVCWWFFIVVGATFLKDFFHKF